MPEDRDSGNSDDTGPDDHALTRSSNDPNGRTRAEPSDTPAERARRPRRTARLAVWSAITLAALLAVGAASVLVLTRNSHPSGHGSATPGHPTRTTHAAACRPRVMRSGFTLQKGYFSGSRSPEHDRIVGGAIVKNPCPMAAVNTRFMAFALNSEGTRVRVLDQLPGYPNGLYDRGHIPLIMPQHTVTIELEFEPVGRQHNYNPGDIERLKVELSNPCWLKPNRASYRTRFLISDVKVGDLGADGYRKDRNAILSFVLDWTPRSAELDATSISVIMRDRNGEVLYVQGEPLPKRAKPGQQQKIRIWIPRSADLSKTKVSMEPNPGQHDWPYSTNNKCRTE